MSMRAEDIEITGIAAGGAGVGRTADGRVLFVQRTAPGDRVRVELQEEKPRWARGRVLSILQASPDRREAPCPHYARCGGCTLEHIQYAAQLRAKSQIVGDAVRRIAVRAIDTPEVVASPREFRYRSRVSFTLIRLATSRVVAGFHELERPGRVLDIGDACLLPEEPVAEAWGALRREWGHNAHRLPSGGRLRLTLQGVATGEVSLLVEGGNAEGRPAELVQRVPGLVSVWQRVRPGKPARLLAGEAPHEVWQDDELEVGGGIFLQVNRAAAALLADYVLALAGDVSGATVLDAYCGVGLHARRLARAGARVTGIELDTQAVAEAERTAPDRARFVAGRVEDHLPAALPADLVIVNPPRAGLAATVPAALAATPPPRMIYVSCDPATLARDLQRLGERFRLASVRCFDLFPQTAHVETVVELTCDTT